MAKSPKDPTTDKPNLHLASSNETPATPFRKKAFKPKVAGQAKLPAATFSPELLSKLLNEVTEQRKMIAELMAGKQAPVSSPAKANGKGRPTSADMAAATIKAFAKIGIKGVQPKIDVLTFNLWLAKGFRPLEGSKSVKVNNLRLFHQSQVRALTKAEVKAAAAQVAAAEARRNANNPSPEAQ